MTHDAHPSVTGRAEPPLADTPEALFAAEAEALRHRREVALGTDGPCGPSGAELPRVGLALSGGGVRSATFGLGLLRGLAQHGPSGERAAPSAAGAGAADGPAAGAKGTPTAAGTCGPLGRIDYLSTVSGGGYVGAMFTRLVHTYGLHAAREQLARSDSPVLCWMRRNGRYLTPAGSRDIGMALVTYLRAWIAIHTEFMFACAFLGLLTVLPHVWQDTTRTLIPSGWSPWVTPWWPLAIWLWMLAAPGLVTGYWAARDDPDPNVRHSAPPWRDVLLLLLLVAIAVMLGAYVVRGPVSLRAEPLLLSTAAACALASAALGQAGVQVWMWVSHQPHALLVARIRNVMTRELRAVTLVALALAGLGVLDALSWWILENMSSPGDDAWVASGLGLGGIALIVLRTLAQPLQQIAADAGTHARRWLPRLINVASLAGLFALITAWLVAVQWFVFFEGKGALTGVPVWVRAAVIFCVWGLWVLLTAGNSQMANTSSLHSFYRARLARAYLAVGNRKRALHTGQGPVSNNDVTLVVEGDDLPLEQHRPETQGGPIHLVTTCLNQTRDDLSGLYNADRKGTALTVTWRGFEVGPGGFVAGRPGQDTGTLGRWVAVSGAAASPGAGAHTSRGLALLVYFLGVRLGHWVRAPRTTPELRWLSHFGWRCLPKPVMLTSEASATFYGVDRPWWYLSDGGHFENTGVYPLLKRELDFILLADAGCDVHYTFGDLENLVRKARIDFGTEIDFYTRAEAARLFTLAGADLTVLSPEELADNHSCRGVLLARIRYRERPGADGRPIRPEGTLLIVKPNLHDALDVDLLSYAQQHPAFPHEGTQDQSFDEAQWESYHRLGEDFGRSLHETWLAQLPGWRTPARHALHVAARLNGAPPVAAPKVEALWRRGARAAAIGTTLGIGVSGTFLLSLWQAHDAWNRNRAEQQSEARRVIQDVSTMLDGISGNCPAVPPLLQLRIHGLVHLGSSPALPALERGSMDALKDRFEGECTKRTAKRPTCETNQNDGFARLCDAVNRPQGGENYAVSYWYAARASEKQQAEAEAKAIERTLDRLARWGQPPPTAASAASSATGVQGVVTRVPGGSSAVEVQGPGSSVPRAVADVASAPVSARSGADVVAGAASGVPQRNDAAVPSAANASAVGTAGTAAHVNAVPAPELPRTAVHWACIRPNEARTTLYIQVYDEATRVQAQATLAETRHQWWTSVSVAPIENVRRTAELRQQRLPTPWAEPTFLLHDKAGWRCAQALSAHAGIKAAVRSLPDSLPNLKPGVIELWLPPAKSKGPERNALR